MDIKQELYDICCQYVEQRMESSREALAQAKSSADEETKASAGDKYETGRAMMQLEMEKNAGQLQEALKLKQVLDSIQPTVRSQSVQAGSLVVTDRDVFFIAISIGKVAVKDNDYLIISAASPIGQRLLGLKVGERMAFRDHTYVIKEIL